MEILCPECQFSREVDETKIPAKSQVATCPKCQTKFKFRELPEETVVPEAETPAPEPAVEETKPSGPVQGTLPTEPVQVAESEPIAEVEAEPEQTVSPEPEAEASGSTFPTITAPGEDPKDGLWDKLNNMTPPEDKPTERKPPVIGSKYKPESNDDQPSTEAPFAAPAPQVPPVEQEPVPGWNGEFSDDFPDPMGGEIPDEEGEDEPGMLVPPPFEQLDRYGFFHGLYMTIKLVLLSPRLFFSVMPVGGGLAKPLTFTILLTMIQGFVQYFWAMAGLSTSVGPDGADTIGGLSGAMAPIVMLLFMPAFIAAGQFLITGIYHVLLILMRGDNQGFEGTFRALAYANAPIVLGIFPMPMAEIEIGWMAVAAIWGLFLTITGLKYIHKTSYAKVIPVALIPLLLGMIAALAVFQGQVMTI